VRRDIGVLLGLGGLGMRLLFVLFAVTTAALAVLGGDVPEDWIETLGLLGFILAAGVVSWPARYPMSAARTVLVIALVVASTAVVNARLDSTGELGFATWDLGAGSFILFTLALRGRIAASWIGMILVCVVTALWSVAATGTPSRGILLVYGQASSLAAGTFFAVLLRSTATRIIAFQEVERRRVGQEQLRQALDRERKARLVELRKLVEGPLHTIAEGRVTDAQRDQFRLLEATLRDGIRAKGLQREPLSTAVRDARMRGSDVVLLDDLGASATQPDIGAAAAKWAAGRVAAAPNGSITVRLSLEGSEPVISVVTEGALPQSRKVSAD